MKDYLVKELRELMELDLLGFEEFYNEQRSEAADRIEELEALAEFVIKNLDVAALDDCESGVASANARAASEYLADFRHTREAIHQIKDKAAELLEGTDDE